MKSPSMQCPECGSEHVDQWDDRTHARGGVMCLRCLACGHLGAQVEYLDDGASRAIASLESLRLGRQEGWR